MAAVTISKIRYKRANSQMMERIPAPFTLRMATSFWRRSVSSVMLEYTPNRVMMMLTIAKKRDDIFQNIFHCLHFVQIILKCTYLGRNILRQHFTTDGFHPFHDFFLLFRVTFHIAVTYVFGRIIKCESISAIMVMYICLKGGHILHKR